MKYNDETKRFALYYFKRGFEKGLEAEEIEHQLLSKLQGSLNEKQELFRDCKAYLFLDEVFINHRDIAIELAEKYTVKQNKHVSLVSEKLITFYTRNGQSEKAKELIENLLKEEPDNKWTIAKKANMLYEEGQYDQVLEFIKQKQDIISQDPVVFNIEYKTLLAKQVDDKVIVDLLKKIPSLNLGRIIEKRTKNVKKMAEYKIELDKMKKTYADKEEINQVINGLMRKINREKSKIRQIQAAEIDDKSIVQNINLIIEKRKEKIQKEQLHQIAEQIENQVIRFAIQCQIESAYGKKGKDIAIRVNVFNKNNPDLDENSKLAIKVLKNYLTGKRANSYLNDDWINFQKKYFNRILDNSKQKHSKEEKEAQTK